MSTMRELKVYPGKRIVEYTILSSGCGELGCRYSYLEYQINELIDNDWSPYGSLAIDSISGTLYQPMVRYG